MPHSRNRRRLILFRHAKSTWPENLADHERPLSDRGQKAAPVMGAWLVKTRLVPDLVLVSTARRTRDTWALASRPFSAAPPSREVAAIYEASPEALLTVVQSVEVPVRTLMLVGHNPGLEELAKLLMVDDGAAAGQRLRTKFPTGAIAALSFNGDWTDLAFHSMDLDRFVTPKSLG